MQNLGRIVVLVDDYEKARDYYQDKLGMSVLFDAPGGADRLLHLGLHGSASGIWLLRAVTPDQRERIGNQTGGYPLGVIYTDSIEGDVERLRQNEVRLFDEIQSEGHALHCRFADLFGNIWVLVQLSNRN